MIPSNLTSTDEKIRHVQARGSGCDVVGAEKGKKAMEFAKCWLEFA